jgi:hypothetical protein
MRRRLLAVSILLVAPTVPVAAQPDSACTWDRCALRIHQGFFGARLVRGLAGEKVAGLGAFPSALPLLAERSDSAAIRYDAFRSKQTGGSVLALLGAAVGVAGLAVLYNDQEGTGTGLMIGGLALTAAGAIVASLGRNDLYRAVWWYNRTFATDHPPEPR